MKNIDKLIEKISGFEEEIGYLYNDKKNAVLALTHSSYANEYKNQRLSSNERLEFLGDSVLSISVSEWIYIKHSELAEGEMTKARASIVCEPSLLNCAEKLKVGEYLLLGKGEELTGGRTRISILSDAFEAIIGSIYIDGGIEKAKEFIYRHMSQLIEDAICGVVFLDYKTQLQELLQKSGDSKITYEIIEENGPDHNKIFISQVKVNDSVMGIGKGKSKKMAEQNAANVALEKFTKVKY